MPTYIVRANAAILVENRDAVRPSFVDLARDGKEARLELAPLERRTVRLAGDPLGSARITVSPDVHVEELAP